jgi:hypothetical protein
MHRGTWWVFFLISKSSRRSPPRKRLRAAPHMAPEDMSTNYCECFYVESASTGRFRRCFEASEGDTRTRGWRLPIRQNSTAIGDASEKVLNAQVIRIAFIGFLCLQGIISGLSVSALYEAFASDSPREFVAQYLAARSDEIRRYFFIGITFCVTGSLCMLEQDDVSQVLILIKGRSTPKSNSSIWYFVLSYYVALIMTLLCSHVDVRMSNISAQINLEGIHISDEKLLSILHQWRVFTVTRSILCFVGWMIYGYRFVIMRTRTS